MPAPSVEQFLEAIKLTILANKRWVRTFCFFNSDRRRGAHIFLMSYALRCRYPLLAKVLYISDRC